MRELYTLCRNHFGEKMTIGRDRCYDIFRANGLVLRSHKRPRTTDSRHPYRIYEDLLNTSPKLVAKRCGELMVSDITYVATRDGWAYLSLITDAATRLIVGHALHPTLDTHGTLAALEKANSFYASNLINIQGAIHHSDRGVQYCSARYVQRLKELNVKISMTQTGDPLHNALAERMNNTIKNGWLFDCEELSSGEVEKRIEHAVQMYNNVRPHQALGMVSPMEALRREQCGYGMSLSQGGGHPPPTGSPECFSWFTGTINEKNLYQPDETTTFAETYGANPIRSKDKSCQPKQEQ